MESSIERVQSSGKWHHAVSQTCNNFSNLHWRQWQQDPLKLLVPIYKSTWCHISEEHNANFLHFQICETTQKPKKYGCLTNLMWFINYNRKSVHKKSMPDIDLLKEEHSCYELHLWMFVTSWITFSIQQPVSLQNILLQFLDYVIPCKLHKTFLNSCADV